MQVKPALGELRIQEVTPGVVSRALAAIAKSSGPGAAKSARACLSGMFGLAILDGAVAANPVRDAVAKITSSGKRPRALTDEQTAELTSLFRADPRAIALDLPGLVDWMLATGSRIGEALALRHGVNGDGRPLLDLGAGTWEVNVHRRARARARACRAAAAKDSRRMANCGAARLRAADGAWAARGERWRALSRARRRRSSRREQHVWRSSPAARLVRV
jgi:integrase